jgi:hypothetical protein
MYGYDVESVNDPCIANADKSVTLGSPLLLPGASMINIFPILAFIPAWFPGASSHKVAAEVKRLTDEVIRFPLDWAKMRMVCHLNILFLFSSESLTIVSRARAPPFRLSLLIFLKRRIRLVCRHKKRRQSRILLIL